MKTVAAKKMASDNVSRVGASFRTFVKLQNALCLFEPQRHSQFYIRDARTLSSLTADLDQTTIPKWGCESG